MALIFYLGVRDGGEILRGARLIYELKDNENL